VSSRHRGVSTRDDSTGGIERERNESPPAHYFPVIPHLLYACYAQCRLVQTSACLRCVFNTRARQADGDWSFRLRFRPCSCNASTASRAVFLVPSRSDDRRLPNCWYALPAVLSVLTCSDITASLSGGGNFIGQDTHQRAQAERTQVQIDKA
jgi:hypothetical protein